MKNVSVIGVVASALLLVSLNARAVSIDVYGSLAPNAYGSPSYPSYVGNAVNALENGASSAGDSSSPSYYSQVTTIHPGDNIATGFNSWRGQANPSGAYANELGNRLHFGFHAVGGGTQISASMLSFSLTDTGSYLTPADRLGLPSADYPTFGALGTYTYSDQLIGLQYGADGVKGGGDDIYITSGPNTQLVDELIGRGTGNAWAVYDDPAFPGATPQEKIDNMIAALSSGGDFDLIGEYRIGGASGSATVHVSTSVPDGGSTALMLGSILPAAFALKRRLV